GATGPLSGQALAVVEIANHNRAGWAGVVARARDFVCLQPTTRIARSDLLILNSLYAKTALLHHTAEANCDLWILHQAFDLVALFLQVEIEVEVVEAPYLVGTVIGAVARADAAVVRHLVQALGAMHGRAHGTYLLA